MWQDCGRKKQKTAVKRSQAMGKNVKLHDFDRGCNSIQNQLLKFYYLA